MRLAAEVDLFRTTYNVPADEPAAIPYKYREQRLGRHLADRVTQLHKSTAIREAKGTHTSALRDARTAELLELANKNLAGVKDISETIDKRTSAQETRDTEQLFTVWSDEISPTVRQRRPRQ